jgi:hypothetical protein
MTDDQRILGRLEGKLDMLLEEHRKLDGKIAHFDRRLSHAEQKIAGIFALAAGAGGLVSVIVTVVTTILGK